MPSVVCEDKHMGSRAVVVICKNAASARNRFGISASSAPSRSGRSAISS
ncbi:MAG: hypothetical protein AAF485_21380 [Chloroflexota bacterium]